MLCALPVHMRNAFSLQKSLSSFLTFTRPSNGNSIKFLLEQNPRKTPLVNRNGARKDRTGGAVLQTRPHLLHFLIQHPLGNVVLVWPTEASLSGLHGLLWMARALDTNTTKGAAIVAALANRSISSRRLGICGSLASSGEFVVCCCALSGDLSSGRSFMALIPSSFSSALGKIFH